MTTTEKWQLKAGPSKFELMLGLFDHHVVSFTTTGGQTLWIRVRSVRVLNDEGQDAWVIKGYMSDKEGYYDGLRECFVIFSSRTRQGTFEDFGPKDETGTPEYLDGLSDQDLQRVILENQKTALGSRDTLKKYLEELSQHDRLVVEALVSQKMIEVSLYSQLDHRAHVIVRSKRSRVARR